MKHEKELSRQESTKVNKGQQRSTKVGTSQQKSTLFNCIRSSVQGMQADYRRRTHVLEHKGSGTTLWCFPVLTAYGSCVLSGTTPNRLWYHCGTTLESGSFVDKKGISRKFLYPSAELREISSRRRQRAWNSKVRVRALNSGGGQHQSVSAFKAGFGYIVGLPVAAYLTWEGRLIEGKGVSPSIPAGLSPEDLLAGEDPQMQKALELVREL
jgi:hypothetical protein